MARPTRFRWVVAGLLFIASALSFFDRQVLSVLAPQILQDLHLTNAQYADAVAAFTLAYSIMFTVGGRLVDYLGTRLGLGMSVVFWTIASLLHAAANNAVQLAFFRFLLGAGEGGCFPGASRGILEWFPKRERALAMGIATTGGSAIGAVLAPPLIVAASNVAGWRGAFIITGLIGVAWIAAWFLLFRPPEKSRHVNTGELELIRSDNDVPTTGPEKPWPISRLLARADVWGIVMTRFLLDPVFYVYMFWIPQYLHRERGASLDEIGRLSWIPFLTLGISSLLGGRLSDHLVQRGWPTDNARKTIMGCAAFLTPVSILALYAPNSLWAVILLGVLMFAHGFWMTNYMTLISDLFPASTVATAVGLSGSFGGIGGFLANLVVGRIVDSVSFTPVFLVCGLLYPLGFLLILLTVRTTRPA